MLKIIRKEQNEIEVGDIFVVQDALGKEHPLMMLRLAKENYGEYKYALLDLTNHTLLRTDLKHVTHAINYIKKEWGEFEVARQENTVIEINL